MLSSLLRSKKRRTPTFRSPFSSHFNTLETAPLLPQVHQHAYHATQEDHSTDDEESGFDQLQQDENEPSHPEEERREDSAPLLPIFSAPHLDALPVYNITHEIRRLIVARCETTLSWDQLRSPQVSQFLLKPIQQRTLAAHFSRATLYALMANCFQFHKEVALQPGNCGTSRTRAMVCELLAIKLLKEFTTRELIDALSYDFDPLHGQMPPIPTNNRVGPVWNTAQWSKQSNGPARISCLEIAIRAQAKRFLAHPLVVRQLEAIWAGTIVFHSVADNLHRQIPKLNPDTDLDPRPLPHRNHPSPTSRRQLHDAGRNMGSQRRAVTLYNPQDASLFKLSRLRVPRYRQFLSTCSFAVLLGLYLAVLSQRPLNITSLEVIFWFWSAGFMLDELVGFNEQGFSLYIMSFWNLFDLGILMLLFSHYCLRLYGIMMPVARKQAVADQAYDILAASAVLLFPRLFSVLDHYRYFSQLLIAFRIMAADLVAVCILIVVACSGFFVAFTFSFGEWNSAETIAYALFQMLMGFTPAAWSLWEKYNVLGRIILTIFLFLCHFVVVTILITVLTNSFMAIVQNANEEHQFVFAVNTFSMVKSDALFSYVAPTNILAWLITPLRYFIPFRQYLKLNRTIIKITHFPILLTIYFYEKTILSTSVLEPTDLIRAGLRSGIRLHARDERGNPFGTSTRLVREPSIATHQKDRVLEEVFRRPFRQDGLRDIDESPDGRRKDIMVKDWMQGIGPGLAQPPDEQDPAEVDRLEALPRRRRTITHRKALIRVGRNFTETTRSIASDPEEFINYDFLRPISEPPLRDHLSPSIRQQSLATDEQGDDERTSDDNNEDDSGEDRRSLTSGLPGAPGETPRHSEKTASKFHSSRPSTARLVSRKASPIRPPKSPHNRNASVGTMLYNPANPELGPEQAAALSSPFKSGPKRSKLNSNITTPPSGGRKTPKRPPTEANRPRAAMLSRSEPMSVPDFGHRLDLSSDLGDNRAVPVNFLDGLPSSFTTNIAYAAGGFHRTRTEDDNRDVLSKLVLARMSNLEEGFREVIKEVKDLRQGPPTHTTQIRSTDLQKVPREKRKRSEKREGKLGHGSKRSRSSTDEAGWLDEPEPTVDVNAGQPNLA